MRRILLFFILTTTTISCKDCPECPECPVEDTSQRRGQTASTCNEVFVVNYSNNLPTDWTNNVVCTRLFNDIYISIDNLADQDKVSWLRRYANHINYDLSYRYIEKAHILEYNPDAAGHTHNYQSFTLNDIKDMLEEENSPFATNNYNHYFQIELDSSGNYSEGVTTSYRVGNKIACYSIPFFRSIVAQLKSSIGTNPTFEYSIVNFENKDRIFLRVRKTDGSYVYYDYSDEPGHGYVKNSPI